MNLSNQYAVYVGTIRGAIAYTQCKGEPPHFQLGNTENSEVTCMEWGRSENEIIVGHKSGAVKLYSALKNKYVKLLDELRGEGPAVGIGTCDKSLIVGRHSGCINIWSKLDIDSFSLNLQNESTLECMVQNKNKINFVGTAGEKNDFKLWDIENKQVVFRAKSLGNDYLNLPIATTVRGICFLPNDLPACATKEGHVLLYDEKAQRKPVAKFNEPKASYTTISATNRERECVVGTTKGYIQLLDMRNPSKCVRTYKSFTGGVTSVVCDPLAPIVVSTSLDRHLRIHNLDTKECLYKQYLKQSLTKLVIKPVVKDDPDAVGEGADNAEVDEEYESLFENMQTVGEKPKKKRKKEAKEGEVSYMKRKKLKSKNVDM